MIEIYGMPHSNLVRSVALTCTAKQQPFQIGWHLNGEEVPFRSEAHRAIHPYSKFPIIYHEGMTLTETLAICRYLDTRFPEKPLQPENIQQRAEHDAWCSRAITQLDQAIIRQYLIEYVVPTGPEGKPNIELMMNNKPTVLKAVSVIEDQLQHRDFICGDRFMLADALITPLAHYATLQKGDLKLVDEDSPIHSYLNRIFALPGAREIFTG
ncbi:glutathione S-transferase family protein [Oceanospirillum linum]|uniref:Glutathione S-transferase n=1 Tax=Oceanospirillum linum TaxID=966 RepID=A0A1T1H860_OCELI|nr:glutathione S-transferase family protein [Oceanospirillum linum]OOV85956.1 hypothetical protein BTA35_0215715 [Oceanospirillum linum]SEG45147.1 glutathione S-transferase [Oleiphilus messinensis]SMP34511.1 glutathione S-transferase [Oceanospirillum linum]